MESYSDSISSSDDDDYKVVMILNSAIVITAHAIEPDRDSTASEKKIGWVTQSESKKYSS